MRKTHKKVKMLKGEKFLYILIVFALILFPIGTVFTKAVLSETNISLEKMKSKIADDKRVKSLQQQVDAIVANGNWNQIYEYDSEKSRR